ncbi:MAG TPA: AMP-binding protein, partial [Candidatus Lustribacter sp.]|nr:AMP-binding protein [Candidatus Lustribacter sp.]
MKTQVFLHSFAQRAPHREALACDGTRITYGEFDRRSNQLAAVLHDRGVRAGDRVILRLSNGLAWPLLCVATMKLGAMVVPVSTRLTAPEVAFLEGDAEPRLNIADDDVAALEADAAGASDA